MQKGRFSHDAGHFFFSVCIFVVIFIYMDNHVLSPEALVVASAVLTLIGYIINWAMMKKSGVQRTRTCKYPCYYDYICPVVNLFLYEHMIRKPAFCICADRLLFCTCRLINPFVIGSSF